MTFNFSKGRSDCTISICGNNKEYYDLSGIKPANFKQFDTKIINILLNDGGHDTSQL